jgi:hypothetical protein
MGRITLHLFAVAVFLYAGMASAQCPSFVHKVNKTKYVDSGYQLPIWGTVVSCFVSGSGLVTARLGSLDAKLIPNTIGDGTCNSPAISDDGQWVLYYGNGKIYLIRIDGQFKTPVPVVSLGGGPGPGFGVCTFWYNAPGTTLFTKYIAYRANGDREVHAVPVTFSTDAAPIFGSDRLIAKFGGPISFTMGIAGNHLFARINTGGADCPRMATIPETGNATDADLWVPAKQQIAGCMCTISHDGKIAGYNSAYALWCACMADQTCNFRHHSLTLVPFQEKTAPSVPWVDTLVKKKAVSINWAPKKYFSFVNPGDSINGDPRVSDFGADFGLWNYTNDNDYIVGALGMANYNITPDSLNKAIRAVTPDTGAIWLVHYPTNTWTRILRPLAPISHNTLLTAPAVWINTGCLGNCSSLKRNARVNGCVPVNCRVFDIRGRVVADADILTKAIPGVYFKVTAQGAMKRIAVGR